MGIEFFDCHDGLCVAQSEHLAGGRVVPKLDLARAAIVVDVAPVFSKHSAIAVSFWVFQAQVQRRDSAP